MTRLAPPMHEIPVMPEGAYGDITPDAAYRARGTARLIDVREAGELARDGYIDGVEHVPLGHARRRTARVVERRTTSS